MYCKQAISWLNEGGEEISECDVEYFFEIPKETKANQKTRPLRGNKSSLS